MDIVYMGHTTPTSNVDRTLQIQLRGAAGCRTLAHGCAGGAGAGDTSAEYGRMEK